MGALAVKPQPARAHEFWLEPSAYAAETGATVTITHRNGQFFKGNSYPLVRAWYKKFTLVEGENVQDIKGIPGDDPAASLHLAKPGLKIVTYLSTPDFLKFPSWKKFTGYLESEGQGHILARHRARGLSETLVRESYSRCAKTLIAVGNGKGADRFTGMPIELVAEQNPYELAAGAPLPVRLLLHGRPAAGLTIKVFAAADRKTPRRYVTDREGRALVPLPHRGAYLLNAVYIFEPPKDKAGKYEWESLWASLTFEKR